MDLLRSLERLSNVSFFLKILQIFGSHSYSPRAQDVGLIKGHLPVDYHLTPVSLKGSPIITVKLALKTTSPQYEACCGLFYPVSLETASKNPSMWWCYHTHKRQCGSDRFGWSASTSYGM
jgi:hypothetical protein